MNETRTQKLLNAKKKYNEVPWIRRDRTCESILGGTGATMLAAFWFASRLGRISEDSDIQTLPLVVASVALIAFICAVILVCVVALTGPVYKSQLDFSKGELEIWGATERAAAAIIVILAFVGTGAFFNWYLGNPLGFG